MISLRVLACLRIDWTISVRSRPPPPACEGDDDDVMMMTFITRRGEGRGKTKKERKATKSKGRGLEEGASRALMRQHGFSSTVPRNGLTVITTPLAFGWRGSEGTQGQAV